MTKKEKKERDPYELKHIYEEMELDLTASLKRNLTKHKLDEEKTGFSWEMWQKATLRNISNFQRENASIIYRARKQIREAIESVLKYFYARGQSNTERYAKNINSMFPQDGKNTAPLGQEPPKETQFFGVNKKKLDALILSSKRDFEEVNNAVYRKMDDVYRWTMYNVEYQLSSGVLSLNQAIDKAVEKFLAKGIDSIVYKNGRHINIATYAEMALRTASQRATFLGEGSKRDEYGVHLVFVSSHANCCKLCLPWQGKVLIDDIFSHPSDEYIAKYKGKYDLLSIAIKAGLLHPNCRHTIATYFDGITRLPVTQNPEKALENYNNEQQQRKLENKIRKLKRIAAGTVDEENHKLATNELRNAQKELSDFLEQHPEFKRQRYREKTYGFKAMEVKETAQYKKAATFTDGEIKYIEKEFGKLNTNEVIMMNERVGHIKERHPEVFDTIMGNYKKCIINPDIVLADSKNANTIMMVKHLEESNLNAIVKLSIGEGNEGKMNSVITAYCLGEKRLKRTIKNNKTVYIKNE